MSTISRRDFMKTAGVMTLAVAASAALAGCSTNGDSSSTTTEEKVNKDSNDAKNASTTYGNGDSATFGYYNHVITARTKLYKTHRNGDPSTFNAILGVQISIHSSETISYSDKATYYGKTSTNGQSGGLTELLDEGVAFTGSTAAHKVVLDVDVDGTKLTSSTNEGQGKISYIMNSGSLYAYQDGILDYGNSTYSTDTSGAKKACYDKVKGAFVDETIGALTYQGYGDWVEALAGKDIAKGGESAWMLFNIPLTEDGTPAAKTVNVKFYNNNYMVASAPIKFEIPQTAEDINFAYTGSKSAYGV